MNNKSKLSRNTLANIISRVWGFISTFIFVPFYIQLLGEDEYGIVSFFIILQALTNVLGLGLSNTLRRSFATEDISFSARNTKYKLFRSVEVIYALIGFFIIVLSLFFSEDVATNFLKSENVNTSMASNVVILMTVSISVQMIAYLIHGCILGLGFQVAANIYSIIWSLVKSIGSLVTLYLWRDIQIFYFWHIITDITYLFFIRIYLIRKLKQEDKMIWSINDFSLLRSIWRYALGLSFISVVSIITKQFDKLIISNKLSLTELGAYNTVYTLGNIPQIFVSAIGLAVFTHFTNLYSSGKIESLNNDFNNYFKSSAIFIVSTSSFIAMFSKELILVWTKSEIYGELLTGVSFYVILGSMFLALQEIPYSYLLSRGITKVNRRMSILSLPFILIGSFVFVDLYGLIGAAITYCTLMMIQTFIYINYTCKKYIFSDSFLWVNKNLSLPLILSLLFATISRLMIDSLNLNLLLTVIFAVLSGFLTLIFLMLILNKNNFHRLVSTYRKEK